MFVTVLLVEHMRLQLPIFTAVISIARPACDVITCMFSVLPSSRSRGTWTCLGGASQMLRATFILTSPVFECQGECEHVCVSV